MSAVKNEKQFDLGPYRVDCQRRRVSYKAGDLSLHWRSFEILRTLIEARGEVVDKNRLFDLLWPGVTVEESNLNKYISQLRKALNSEDPARQYIETVPRVGYRLLVPAQECQAGTDTGDAAISFRSGDPRERPRFLWKTTALAAIVISTALFAWWKFKEHDQYLQSERIRQEALKLLRKRDLPSMRTAADQFRQLVELQPTYASGWAGLAEASALIHPEDASVGLELARRAVGMDSACGECQGVLGFILFTRFWMWDEARQHLERAVALSPNDAQLRYWLAQLDAAGGRPDRALLSLDDAIKRLPNAMNLLVMKAGCQYFCRDYLAALRTAEQAIALNLHAAWQWRAATLFQLGKHEEAIRSIAYDQGLGSSRSLDAIAARADTLMWQFRQAGLKGPLESLLEQTNSPGSAAIQAHSRASWFMMLGRHDAAIRELEIAVESQPRPFNLIYVGVDPLYDPIRRDVKFRALSQRLGIMAK